MDSLHDNKDCYTNQPDTDEIIDKIIDMVKKNNAAAM